MKPLRLLQTLSLQQWQQFGSPAQLPASEDCGCACSHIYPLSPMCMHPVCAECTLMAGLTVGSMLMQPSPPRPEPEPEREEAPEAQPAGAMGRGSDEEEDEDDMVRSPTCMARDRSCMPCGLAASCSPYEIQGDMCLSCMVTRANFLKKHLPVAAPSALLHEQILLDGSHFDVFDACTCYSTLQQFMYPAACLPCAQLPPRPRLEPQVRRAPLALSSLHSLSKDLWDVPGGAPQRTKGGRRKVALP